MTEVSGSGQPLGKTSSELELGEALLWEFFDSAPDGIVVVSDTGQMLAVNQQTERLFGYDRSSLVGQPVEMLLPDGLRLAHRAHRTRFRAEPRARPMGVGLKLQGQRADGSTFPIEISLSPLQPAREALVIASVRDLSERMAAEARVAEVLSVLDGIEDAVFLFDRESLRFTYVNQGAVEQVGYGLAELREMTMLHLAPELDRAEFDKLLVALEGDEARSRRLTSIHRRKDGVDIPVELIIQAPAPVEHVAPLPFVAIARDISERLGAEQQLRKTAEDLAIAEEREQIASGLHDTVIQRIFAAGLSLQAAVATSREPAVVERIQDVVDQLDRTIREVRGAIFRLQRPGAQTRWLRDQVLALLDQSRNALGFAPHLVFDGPIEAVGVEVAPELVATLRELLAHAGATEVTVEISAGPEVMVRVTTNGAGPFGGAWQGGGNHDLAARAEALGGSFEVTADASGYTAAVWRVPAS
jgi:PAS domain S-box-containing protein